MAGFEAFEAACHARGFTWHPRPAAENAGALDWTRLGAEVDADVARAYQRCDGGRLWELVVPPRDRLVEDNLAHRTGRDDWPVLADVVLYAAWQGLAWNLATVPALADEHGRQLVVWVDRYDEGSITPIASSVDRCFALLAEHVTRFAPAEGEDSDVLFPESVASTIGDDEALMTALRSNEGPLPSLLSFGTGPEPWLAKLLARPR